MVKEGYKQTEVGMIPEDWVIDKFGNLVNYVKGFAFKSSDYKDNGIRIIRVSDTTFDSINDNNAVYISGKSANHYKKWVLQENDLVFSTVGSKPPMYDSLVGKAIIITKTHSGSLLNQNAVLIRAKNYSSYIQKLLLSHFRTERYIDYIKLIYRGNANQASITLLDLFNFKIPLSNTTQEQTLIAQALSDVDALITSLDKLIAKKQAIKTATMQQLLTGKKRLPGFGEEWSLLSMAKHASLKARIGWQALTTEEYLENGEYYLVTGTDFINGRVNWSTCHYIDEWRYIQDRNIQLKNGDVLLTKDGTIGKVGYVDNLLGEATLNSGVFVIRPLNGAFNSLFLFYVLTSSIFDDFLSKITAGSTITHLYQKDFVTFYFSAPKTNEQTAIAQVLSDMDTEIITLQSRLTKTKSIKQGMMQELLTGKTRLIDKVSGDPL